VCDHTAGHTWRDNLGGILYGLGGADQEGGGMAVGPSTEVGVGA